MSETSDVTSPLIAALNSLPGVYAERQHAGRVRARGGYVHHCRDGWPDILVVHGERCMFIETKAIAGKLRATQHELFMDFERHGVRVRIARTVRDGLEHVTEWLREGAAK